MFGGPADDPFAHADSQALCFGRMADLKAHTQVVGPLIQQQDGENLVVDDGAHQVRSAMQQSLQIQGGVQGVRQPYEELGLQRVYSHRSGHRESF